MAKHILVHGFGAGTISVMVLVTWESVSGQAQAPLRYLTLWILFSLTYGFLTWKMWRRNPQRQQDSSP